jgi:spermidine synthase
VKKQPAPFAEQVPPLSLRRFLYTSAAITGGAIMIIEILGARMLAPFFGTSHFVWTAQIAVTLVALATGYYVGGRLVDQQPKLGRIYFCVLLSAIYLAVAVPMVETVSYASHQFRLDIAALLASAFLFFVPLALLAMVGPFLIRVLTVSVSTVGGNIGRLTAISTFGSFAGTILIGYVLIPSLPNSKTMYLTAILLILVALTYFLAWERSAFTRPAAVVVMLVSLVLVSSGFARSERARFKEMDELYRANSSFGLLQVLQNKRGDRRFYLNDYLVQNTYDPIEKKSLAVFTYALHDLAWAYTPQLERALCIGLGIGMVPMELAQAGVHVDVVEINPASVPVAAKYFDCDTTLFQVVIGDGRYFINRTTNQYDTVIIDAFLGDSSPSHLMSKEAFQGVKRILNPGGTVVMNMFGDFQPGRDFFTASLDKTLRAVFRSVRIHASGNGNVFYVASDRPDLEISSMPDFDRVHESCRSEARAAFHGVVRADPESGIVLLDDYNPVEFYDAASREEHRRRLAMGMKSL